MRNYELNDFDKSLIDYFNSNGYYSSNFVISPVSVRASLCLVAAGAKGETHAELLRAAGFSSTEDMTLWATLYRDAISTPDGLRAATSLWSSKELSEDFDDLFKGKVQAQFGAKAKESGNLTKEVSAWIESKTNGAIPFLAGDLNGASTALISALSMNTMWQNAFPEEATFEDTFTDATGEKTKIEFMKQTAKFFYAEESGEKIYTYAEGTDKKSSGFKNSVETYDLTVSKTIAGNQGDKEDTFRFTLTIENATPGTYTVTYNPANSEKTPAIVTVNSEGKCSETFTLGHAESFTSCNRRRERSVPVVFVAGPVRTGLGANLLLLACKPKTTK